MFDWVEIVAKAGDGGNGRVSFRRERFVPFGGPDGGDGGDGGDIVVRADASMSSLRVFPRKRLYRAGNGGNGQNKRKHGKQGKDLIITVPLGTVVWCKMPDESEVFLADLEESGQQVIVAKGGRGGLGNTRFASSTRQAPQTATAGQIGEGNRIILDLRLIADVGIVGYPNAGKSTLLAQATAARPKIASYPFTTLEPVLGVAEVGSHRFVLAEIPGLVSGAHLGRGLGHDFLRHIARTKAIVHLIDGSSPSPVESMIAVNNELALFDSDLARKRQLVAVNKVDLPEVRARVDGIREAFAAAGVEVRFISAATGAGVAELLVAAGEMVRSMPAAETRQRSLKIFRPKPVDVKVGGGKKGDNSGNEYRRAGRNLRPDT